MHSPDSLLTVVRHVGHCARLPASSVLRTYAAIQDAGLLPRSRGRAIHLARPEDVATLLIGLAVEREARTLKEMIFLIQHAQKDGSGWEGDELRAELVRLLTDAAAADTVEEITFDLDRQRAVIVHDGKRTSYFHEEETIDADGFVHDTTHEPAPLISHIGKISGDLVRILSRTIQWVADPVGAPQADEIKAE